MKLNYFMEGAWHQRAGQGIDLFVRPSRNLGAVYWYTLPHMWYYGVFPLDEDDPVFTIYSGKWNRNEPEPFSLIESGIARIKALGVDRLVLSYWTDRLGRDAIEMSPVALSTNVRNGSFYDKRLNGTGWTVHNFNDDFLSAHWYTYDEAGNPAWYSAQGKSVEPDTYELILYQSSGRFRYGEGKLEDVGHVSLTFNDKDKAECNIDLRGNTSVENWSRLI